MMVLARLTVDQRAQGHKLGASLLHDVVNGVHWWCFVDHQMRFGSAASRNQQPLAMP